MLEIRRFVLEKNCFAFNPPYIFLAMFLNLRFSVQCPLFLRDLRTMKPSYTSFQYTRSSICILLAEQKNNESFIFLNLTGFSNSYKIQSQVHSRFQLLMNIISICNLAKAAWAANRRWINRRWSTMIKPISFRSRFIWNIVSMRKLFIELTKMWAIS